MNSPIETLSAAPSLFSEHEGPPPTLPAPRDSASPSPNIARRRRGKIALLPKSTREQINLMLEDGLPYRAIIEKLQEPGAPPLPYAISEHNLSEWKDGGYQDWLKIQFWQDELRARCDAFSGILTGTDPIQLPEGGLQLAAVGICELLRDLSPRHHDADADPDKYIRAANSLSRLSRSILHIQHYRDICAGARAALNELKDPKRKLTQSETRAIVQQVDTILGLDSEADIDWSQFRGGDENPNSELRTPKSGKSDSGSGEPETGTAGKGLTEDPVEPSMIL